LNLRSGVAEASQDRDVVNQPGLGLAFGLETVMGATSADQCAGRGKETILLVEDEEFVRKATAEVLESAGYRVILAGNASQALEAQRNCFEFVDLLLADVVMPGISGHQLAIEFLALRPQVRVLLMSGYAEQLTVCEMSPHRKEYLAKPFSIPTLLQRVRGVLDEPSFDFGISA
jgi:two-component system, cell cycle sensor histidine kinase and response regulator CckA